MSLYRHVASKDELVRRMLDVALGTAPPLETTDWRTGLDALVARRCSRSSTATRGGSTSRSPGSLGTHAQLSWLDRGLEALAADRLDEGEKAELVLLLNGYVFWAARLRLPGRPTTTRSLSSRPGSTSPRSRRCARALAAGIFEDDYARTTRTSSSASSACSTASGR